MADKVLDIKNLRVSFQNTNSVLTVVRGLDFSVEKGQIVGILGESGSGKTVSATAVLDMFEPSDGCQITGEIQSSGTLAYLFQNPTTALNPYRSIGTQLRRLLKHLGKPVDSETIFAAFAEVGLDDGRRIFHALPSQLSGGQNQRVLLAQALLTNPALLIADEPTSAIDASVSQKVLDLLVSLNQRHHMAIIVITHDFDVAKALCHHILVMYGGLIVEEGATDQLLTEPLHPYTTALLRCSESLNSGDPLVYTLEGNPPTPQEFKDECPFYSRCPVRIDRCREGIPPMLRVGQRRVRCVHSSPGKNHG